MSTFNVKLQSVMLPCRGYIAPEIIDKGEISFKSDIFSLGIIIIKLLTGSDHHEFENVRRIYLTI